MKPLGPLVFCLAILSALAGPASAQDDPGIRVLKSRVLPLMAGPANTAAILSPDGQQILHVDINEICTLGRADGGSWPEPLVCVPNTAVGRLGLPEDMAWSPTGRLLLLPTYGRAFYYLEDTDIALVDAGTLSRTVLTDDGFEGRIFDDGPASLDVVARWVDADTIAFLRYPVGAGGVPETGGAALMTIEADGSGERRVLEIPQAGRLAVYTLAISPDGRTAAYGVEDRMAPGAGGIWTLPMDGSTAPVRLAAADAVGAPVGLAFSADGRYLVSLTPREDGVAFDARIVERATGAVSTVDAARPVVGVAWAPTGSALAYVTGREASGSGGLFLVETPSAPGRLLLEGAFMPPVCCGRQPFVWAADGGMLLGRVDEGGQSVLYVRLGR